MDFDFTPEQEMLRDSLARYFADTYTFARRQQMLVSGPGWRADVWRGLATELGILGAPFPADHGGLGGGAIENMIVMEEIGRALVVEPYLETVVIGGRLLRRWQSRRAREWIERIIAGDVRLVLAHLEPTARFDPSHVTVRADRRADGWSLRGLKTGVRGVPFATHLLVTARSVGEPRGRGGIGTFLVECDAPGVSVHEYPTVDGSRSGDVHLDGAAAEPIADPGDGYADLEAALDEGVAGLCAEAVGVMRRLLADTVDYTKQRRQFGAPIAANQVLQHRMVDMYMALEQAVSMSCVASLGLELADAERVRAVAAAKVYVGKALKFVGQSAIQLHGGIGMTNELAVSHYFKRATVIESQLGSADYHATRLELRGSAA
jgi:alkylation response protein AidB-like acyl-CoA dehydrogenase